MEKNDVEIALQRRNAVKQLRQIGARTQMEKIKSALPSRTGRIRSDGALFDSGSEAREQFRASLLFFRVAGEGKNFRGKPRFEVAAHGGPGKIEHIGNDAMAGEDDQILAASVDEGHHGALVIRVGLGR